MIAHIRKHTQLTDLILNIEKPIAVIASLLIVLGQVTYFFDVWKNKVQPSIMSWCGWALLMGTLCVAQYISVGWDWSLLSIITCTLGCIAIGTASILKKNYILAQRDWYFLFLGIFCIILYLISNDPWLTTIYAAIADLVIGLPTIIKAYKNPEKEKSKAWLISLASWSLTLAISFHHDLVYAIFPVYVWLYCACIVFLLYFKGTKSKGIS